MVICTYRHVYVYIYIEYVYDYIRVYISIYICIHIYMYLFLYFTVDTVDIYLVFFHSTNLSNDFTRFPGFDRGDDF